MTVNDELQQRAERRNARPPIEPVIYDADIETAIRAILTDGHATMVRAGTLKGQVWRQITNSAAHNQAILERTGRAAHVEGGHISAYPQGARDRQIARIIKNMFNSGELVRSGNSTATMYGLATRVAQWDAERKAASTQRAINSERAELVADVLLDLGVRVDSHSHAGVVLSVEVAEALVRRLEQMEG